MLDKVTGKMQAMEAEAGRIIRMEPRCPGVEYEDTGAGVRSEPLDAETRMKEYKRFAFPLTTGFELHQLALYSLLQKVILHHIMYEKKYCIP